MDENLHSQKPGEIFQKAYGDPVCTSIAKANKGSDFKAKVFPLELAKSSINLKKNIYTLNPNPPHPN